MKILQHETVLKPTPSTLPLELGHTPTPSASFTLFESHRRDRPPGRSLAVRSPRSVSMTGLVLHLAISTAKRLDVFKELLQIQ